MTDPREGRSDTYTPSLTDRSMSPPHIVADRKAETASGPSRTPPEGLGRSLPTDGSATSTRANGARDGTKPEPPFLKRLERGLMAVFKLGRTEAMAKRASRSISDLRNRMDDLARHQTHLAGSHSRLDSEIREAEDKLESIRADLDRAFGELDRARAQRNAIRRQVDLRLGDFGRAVDVLSRRLGPAVDISEEVADETALRGREETLQAFMAECCARMAHDEDATPNDTRRRRSVHLADLRSAVDRTGGLPVLDLACGAGDVLALLKAEGIPSYGVEPERERLATALSRELDARREQPVAALEATPRASLAAVTAFGLVQTLPFESVARIARAAFEVLAPGGLLLFETPITVDIRLEGGQPDGLPASGALTERAQIAVMQTAGFEPVHRRALNPHPLLEDLQSRRHVDVEIAGRLFGPQDLVVTGTRPSGVR